MLFPPFVGSDPSLYKEYLRTYAVCSTGVSAGVGAGICTLDDNSCRDLDFLKKISDFYDVEFSSFFSSQAGRRLQDATRGDGRVGSGEFRAPSVDGDSRTGVCEEKVLLDVCVEEKNGCGADAAFDARKDKVCGYSGFEVGSLNNRLPDDQLGPNTLRNRKARQEKKEKKNRRKLRDASFSIGDAISNVRLDQIKKKKFWRDGDAVGSDKDCLFNGGDVDKSKGSQGFWNSCSDEIRQQLIDSKAQMHIAENRRKKVAADLKYQQDQAALSAANSVPMLVSQMVAVSKLANQLVKTTKDDQVHGWAKTVADSLTKSVAESAISKSDSLPSLESVGYGDSALKSSDGDSVRSRRLLLYQAKVEEFDKLVEEDSFDTVNQEVAYKKKLDDEYADVLLSEREFFEKKMTDSVVNYYMSNGKGLQEIELAIVGMGLPPRDLHAEFYSEI